MQAKVVLDEASSRLAPRARGGPLRPFLAPKHALVHVRHGRDGARPSSCLINGQLIFFWRAARRRRLSPSISRAWL